MEGDAFDCVYRDDVVRALNETKAIKAPGPSAVSLELMAAS